MKFNLNDAIVVIEGPFNGWVGYFKGYLKDDYVRILYMSCDGEEIDTLDIPAEYIKNVEPSPGRTLPTAR